MIDFAAGWIDLEQLCFPLTQRAKSRELELPTLTYKSDILSQSENTPQLLLCGDLKHTLLTQNNVTSALLEDV